MSRLKIILFVLLATGLAGWGILHRHDTTFLSDLTADFTQLHQAHPIEGIVVFGVLQTVIAICGVLPASVGAVASGMVFGVVDGFFIAATATLLGALCAFWLSRSLLRAPIERFMEMRRFLLALENMAADQGWKIVCLLRISPVLPFAITSYALGFTALSTKDYLVGTLASLPALLGYVILASLTQTGLGQFSAGTISYVRLIMSGVAILGTVLLVWQFGKTIARYLDSSRTIESARSAEK